MTEYNMPIKTWSVEDRPREKLVLKGLRSLSDAELIAILLGSGTREESAVELARRLLKHYNDNLNELSKATAEDLKRFKGIGEARAVTVIAALELGRRRNAAEVIQRKKITSSADVSGIFCPLLGDLPYEEFWVILLNRANKIIDTVKISQGGLAGTVTDIRIILRLALERLASSIILVHNHPSGNLKPSESDIHLTKRLKEGGALMDIAVLDHVIVSDHSALSFADEGII